MWTEEMNVIFEQLSQSDAAASPEALYKELLREISGYHPSNDTTMIEKAYQTASLAHTGQTRKSGEPYIIHPLCVAIILSKLKMDKETIEAALLHDVVEDTGMTNEELADIFGEDVAQLGDVIILPKGSTSIDFAYSIHTVIGNTMTGSLINKAEAPITRPLRGGDIVEIITSSTADGPGGEWLRHVKTPQAKNKIKEWLKKHPKQEDADRKEKFVLLDIKVKNRVGMLEDITRILAAHKMKIRTIRVKNENKEPVAITVEICVGNMQVPAEMTAQIAAVSEVSSVDMRVVS